MTPEERRLLERAVKLSEQNHDILRSFQSKARWAFIWGVVKFVAIVAPLVIGFLLYFEPLKAWLSGVQEVFKAIQ